MSPPERVRVWANNTVWTSDTLDTGDALNATPRCVAGV
jgi:hypothetical protein